MLQYDGVPKEAESEVGTHVNYKSKRQAKYLKCYK